jgi:hypothetical protein
MKVKRSMIEQMVREELAAYVKEQLGEAPGGPGVDDADKDRKSKERKGGKGEESPVGGQQDPDNLAGKPKTGGETPPADEPPTPPEQELEPEPADDELEDQPEPEGDDVESAEDDAKSDISDELVGKTVQSITMEPKSKLMPGAMEIVLTFDQVTDQFRILIGKSGQVKFYFRGLHNEL